MESDSDEESERPAVTQRSSRIPGPSEFLRLRRELARETRRNTLLGRKVAELEHQLEALKIRVSESDALQVDLGRCTVEALEAENKRRKHGNREVVKLLLRATIGAFRQLETERLERARNLEKLFSGAERAIANSLHTLVEPPVEAGPNPLELMLDRITKAEMRLGSVAPPPAEAADLSTPSTESGRRTHRAKRRRPSSPLMGLPAYETGHDPAAPPSSQRARRDLSDDSDGGGFSPHGAPCDPPPPLPSFAFGIPDAAPEHET